MAAINYLDNVDSEAFKLSIPRIETEVQEKSDDLLKAEGGYPDLLEDIRETLPELEEIRSLYSAAVIKYDEACFAQQGGQKVKGAVFRILLFLFLILFVGAVLGYVYFRTGLEQWHLDVAGGITFVAATAILLLNWNRESEDIRRSRQELEVARKQMSKIVKEKMDALLLIRNDFEQEIQELKRQITGRA